MIDPNAVGGWATVYAAIVATGALFLEVRRWFESGAKLSMGYMLNGITYPKDDDKKYIVVNVANRGDTATTLTHLVLQVYPTRWHRWRKKPSSTFVIVRPVTGQQWPHILAPGTQWTGMGIQDENADKLIDAGTLWAEVYATHANRPAAVRLKRRPEPKGKKLEGPKD